MTLSADDTIAAVATPPGVGGISVLRLSGREALAVADKVFIGASTLSSARTQTAHFGRVKDHQGLEVDDVVAVVFRGPGSYTGEDVVEISCHGGPYITRKVLETLLQHGARLAEPGEFTKRAFVNGKMDLAQAEAVADLIHSWSDLAHRSSLQQLGGGLSSRVIHLRDQLVATVGLLELELDFVEEAIELVDKKKIEEYVSKELADLDRLIRTFKTGKVIRDGVKTAIAGSPNVGKSSLLNALLSQSRAIVTDVPGTTRDVIEEAVLINGLPFVLADTAGDRHTEDVVEREGVLRSRQRVETCDLLLLVFDGSKGVTPEDMELAERLITKTKPPEAHCVVVLNKQDLGVRLDQEKLAQTAFLGSIPCVRISALTGDGMDDLRQSMFETANVSNLAISEGGAIVTNERHQQALQKAKESLTLALESVRKGESGEFVAVDLRGALDRLGEIIGTTTTDDILNRIFSNFCIGK